MNLFRFPPVLYHDDMDLDTSVSVEKDIFYQSIVSVKRKKNLYYELNKSKFKEYQTLSGVSFNVFDKINILQFHLSINQNIIRFTNDYIQSPISEKEVKYKQYSSKKSNKYVECYILVYFVKHSSYVKYDIVWEPRKKNKELENAWTSNHVILDWINELEWKDMIYNIVFIQNNRFIEEENWKYAYILRNNRIYPKEYKVLFDALHKNIDAFNEIEKNIKPIGHYQSDFDRIHFFEDT